MIFDDTTPPPERREPPREEPVETRRRRRRSSPSGSSGGRRRSSRSSFDEAMRLEAPRPPAAEPNHIAWLWVLGLLIVAVLGFSWYLHANGPKVAKLPGGAPSGSLKPYIDPVLAPLEAGQAGFSTSSLDELAGRFRNERAVVEGEAKEIYSMAITMAEILREALADRERHLERMGQIAGRANAITTNERKHLELAVSVSWQRNSGAYRDRLEELWGRVTRMEYGRGSAPAVITPSAPEPAES